MYGEGWGPRAATSVPDDRLTLVTSGAHSTSVIDNANAREIERVPIGRHARSIVVAPDSSTAYVAVMSGDVITKVDLTTFDLSTFDLTTFDASEWVWPGDRLRHILVFDDTVVA
jgi:DNA-binding beta-propeller fold protein YncE